jgi:glutamate-1-semialdehyde 2,1-aminomutase
MRKPTSKKTIAIVQARVQSQRLPGKVLADIHGYPAIHYVLTRLQRARRLDEIWLACSAVSEDDPLAAYAQSLAVRVWRGDEMDVVSRFVGVTKTAKAETIVRITGDCPLIDPDIVDLVVERFHDAGVDFVSNTLERTYPDGLDVEVFSRDALQRTDREARDPFLRLHVTPYIHGRLRDRLPWGGFSVQQVTNPVDFSHLRWTLDEADDLEFLRQVIPKLDKDFRWLDVVALCTREPELLKLNCTHHLYEGTERDFMQYSRVRQQGGQEHVTPSFATSNELFEQASRIIPLGSQTFSKSHQQWVRGATPLFLKSGHGCRVTDVDDNSYIDYVLGLLPVVLGYRDQDVDSAIRRQLQDGITFSLPSPLELTLAERLIRLIPCAEMVRFGKNGSDVTTAAVRLARATTGRDKVAMCGYHGWHDWSIGTTTRRLGVPEAVRGLTTTFPYNDADALAELLRRERGAYAAVILEPVGASQPSPGFLQRVRELTEQDGAVLIFDEIITGFRINMGGAQAEYGVIPDLATFGKSMANGMPVSALVGRAGLMNRLQDVFVSSTFGGETLSLVAAIATIDKLEREQGIERLKKRGRELTVQANSLFERHGFGDVLRYAGSDWWPRLAVTRPPVDGTLLTSLLRQECVANGLLLGASFNLCLAHDQDAVVRETVNALDASLKVVRRALDSPDPSAHLKGKPIQPVFSVR